MGWALSGMGISGMGVSGTGHGFPVNPIPLSPRRLQLRDTMRCGIPCGGGIPCPVGYHAVWDTFCWAMIRARVTSLAAPAEESAESSATPAASARPTSKSCCSMCTCKAATQSAMLYAGCHVFMFYVSQEPLQRASARPRSAQRRCDAPAGRNGAVGAGLAAFEVCAVFRTRQAHPRAGMPHTTVSQTS